MDRRIERQLQGELIRLFSKRIDEKGYKNKIHYPSQEENRSDILLKDNKGNPVFFIELKDPISTDGKSVYNHSVIGREFERSKKLGVKYFGITNFIEGNLITTECSENHCDWIVEEGNVLTLSQLNRLRTNFEVKNDIEEKLIVLVDWYLDRCIEILDDRIVQTKPIDEIFIYKIKSLIRGYIDDITEEVWREFQNNKQFKKDLSDYSISQQWTIPKTREEIENLTYISILLLISKLIFYKSLYDFKSFPIPVLSVPLDINDREIFRKYLWKSCFEELKEITGDFELLIGEENEIMNRLPYYSDVIVDLVSGIIHSEERYDFSKLNYDIIGRIFEDLIREDERHKLGQYFTPSQVVDLINSFCIRTGKETIIDTSCGSGTFLVRGYDRKRKLQEPKLVPHPKLLSDIFGIDISSYSSFLSILNLSMRDLRHIYPPRIIKRDFFDIKFNNKETIKGFGGEEILIPMREFDCVIGNPPYTRQEEIDSYIEDEKTKINEVIRLDWGKTPNKKTSLYGHFFYHSGKMLKDGGYLGFITSNSWLDTEYGQELQEWMCQYFKIICIIDSKVERFFPSADVNTCITILQRVGGEKTQNDIEEQNERERDHNTVRFVYLKRKLEEIFQKFRGEDNIRDFILNTSNLYEDEYFHIKPMKQKELQKETKWGKYLRSPEVYWKILEKGKGKWKRLGDVGTVRFGLKTGVNEFFIFKDVTDEVTDNKLLSVRNLLFGLNTLDEIKNKGCRVVENGLNELWVIEQDLLKPIIKSSREIKYYTVDGDTLKYKVLLINIEKTKLIKEYPFVWEYIKWGEKQDYHNRPTCKSRNNWWSLGEWNGTDLITLMSSDNNHPFFLNLTNVIEDNRLYGININEIKDKEILFLFLNSIISLFQIQIHGRTNFGLGVLDFKVYEVEEIQVIQLNEKKYDKLVKEIFQKLIKKQVKSVYEEIGTENTLDVTLDNVNPLRLELDRLVLEIIGFTDIKERDEVLLELYRSVIDLVKSRLEKSQSVGNVKKKGKIMDNEVYLHDLRELLQDDTFSPVPTNKYYHHLKKKIGEITLDKKYQKTLLSKYWKELFDEELDITKLKKEDEQELFK